MKKKQIQELFYYPGKSGSLYRALDRLISDLKDLDSESLTDLITDIDSPIH